MRKNLGPQKNRLAPGTRINHLTVIRLSHYGGKNEEGAKYYQVRCDCGNEKEIKGTSLTPTGTKSCGQKGCPHFKWGTTARPPAPLTPAATIRQQWDAAARHYLRALSALVDAHPAAETAELRAYLATVTAHREAALQAARELPVDPLYDDL